MTEEPTSHCLVKNKVRNPITCLDIRKSVNQGGEEDDGSEILTNVFVHVCDVEGREFTSYTTFHGMIRIFNSKTWTSLIYWSFVVLMCLTFYYFYSFNIIHRFILKPTYQEIDYVTYSEDEFIYPKLIVCPLNPYSRTALERYVNESTYDLSNSFYDLNLRPNRWQLSVFNGQAGTNFSMAEVNQLQEKLIKNCYEIVSRTVINDQTVNLCDDSEFIDVGYGYCLSLDLRKRKENYGSVTIGFKNQDADGYRIFIEPQGAHLLTFSNVVHLMPSTRASVYIKLRNNTFLSKDKGGNCIRNWDGIPLENHLHEKVAYSMKTCELIRVAHISLKTQNCIPFSLRKLFRKKFLTCNNTLDVPGSLEADDELTAFKCYPECEKKEFLFTRISTRYMNSVSGSRNISIIKISFDKTIKLIRSQSRLLHLVGVLAKLGGNTSLFCGFSCVTLMETFIFLFKSVIHLARYGTVGPAENEEAPRKKSFIKIISIDATSDNGKSITVNATDYNNRKGEGNSYSLPSTPVNTDIVISFPRKISLPTGHERNLCPRFTIIDTISERDESENPKTPVTPIPQPSTPEISYERQMRPAFRKLRARDRFRDSINSMTFDTRYRMDEAFVGFGASMDLGSFSSPLQGTGPRGSLISIGQISVSNDRRRTSKTKSKSLYRYNSGLGDF